jgi:hypothetical protein
MLWKARRGRIIATVTKVDENKISAALRYALSGGCACACAAHLLTPSYQCATARPSTRAKLAAIKIQSIIIFPCPRMASFLFIRQIFERRAGALGADTAAVLLRALLSRLVLDRARLVLRQGLTGLNYDATRLHGLWQLTDQFYLEQPVFAGSALDFHIISQAEAALEGATRDSSMEISVTLVAVDNASDRQHVLLDRNVKLVGLEAGYGERDAIGILAGAHDVAGGIVVFRLIPKALIDHIEQAVEADAGSPEGIKVQVPHSHILIEQHGYKGRRSLPAPITLPSPQGRSTAVELGELCCLSRGKRAARILCHRARGPKMKPNTREQSWLQMSNGLILLMCSLEEKCVPETGVQGVKFDCS